MSWRIFCSFSAMLTTRLAKPGKTSSRCSNSSAEGIGPECDLLTTCVKMTLASLALSGRKYGFSFSRASAATPSSATFSSRFPPLYLSVSAILFLHRRDCTRNFLTNCAPVTIQRSSFYRTSCISHSLINIDRPNAFNDDLKFLRRTALVDILDSKPIVHLTNVLSKCVLHTIMST